MCKLIKIKIDRKKKQREGHFIKRSRIIDQLNFRIKKRTRRYLKKNQIKRKHRKLL